MALDAAAASDHLDRLVRRARAAAVGFGLLSIGLALVDQLWPWSDRRLWTLASLVTVAVPFVGYLLLLRGTRPVTTFLVRGDRFVAPMSVSEYPYIVMLIFLTPNGFRTERGIDGNVHVAAVDPGVWAKAVLMALPFLGAAAWLLFRGPAVIQHPDRLVIRRSPRQVDPLDSLGGRWPLQSPGHGVEHQSADALGGSAALGDGELAAARRGQGIPRRHDPALRRTSGTPACDRLNRRVDPAVQRAHL